MCDPPVQAGMFLFMSIKNYHRIKRIFDIIFSTAVIVIGAPVFVLIAALIRLDSRGDVLYRQIRVGRDGKMFRIFKFRTMVKNAHKIGPLITEVNDSRRTLVGKFLRMTSLDELPNFFNVLLGEMSVIGPRPDIPDIVTRYDKWQKKVLSVKPGITGFSQVLGRQEVKLPTKLRYDRYYVKKENICMDIWILFKTLFVVLKCDGTR